METAKGFEKERYIMTVNQLAVLRTYLEAISQYESFIHLNNSFGTCHQEQTFKGKINNVEIDDQYIWNNWCSGYIFNKIRRQKLEE